MIPFYTKKNDRAKNTLVSAIFLMTGIFTLDFYEMSLVYNLVGLAFMIAGLYGVLCVYKDVKFLFPVKLINGYWNK